MEDERPIEEGTENAPHEASSQADGHADSPGTEAPATEDGKPAE